MSHQEILPSRPARLAQARRLVAAIEAEDEAAERELAEAISWHWSSSLNQDLARLTRELREALGSVRVTDELSRLAHRELPNAHLRLTQVLELTEEAAHRTLGAVEDLLPAADRMAKDASRVLTRWPQSRSMRAPFKLEIHAFLSSLATDAALLKEKLSDVLLAQGYQDLTGQIMRPVVKLIAELESHLVSRGLALEVAPATVVADSRGQGPTVRGLETSYTVSGQDDVDDLLSQFGM